ncbi:hypothetical protein B0T11DRAFT_298893 [Plectosphaerella cucumerina]|uniref:FAD-binding domain-containing protein n=1 Tax=Plectosphaerella cucumerina TaxID=40658 RepID=A0A8K0X0I9_9PEZI|nr:hypothetical protein B0T11DRAFT_298893 [Plectosphaerella cucumerina]
MGSDMNKTPHVLILGAGLERATTYGKKAERIEEREDGVVIYFADGTSATGDVVVDADSVYSRAAISSARKDVEYMLFIGLDSVSDDGKTGNYYWDLIWPCEDGDRDDYWDLKPEFRKVVDRTPEYMVLVPGLYFYVCLIDELPAGRVTILGDAAHAMPSFRGKGGC